MLRRRPAKDGQVPSSASSDPNSSSSSSHTVTQTVEKKKVDSFLTKPRSKRRNSLIFLLGGLFGILFALFFANQQDVISLDSLLDLNLDTLMDAIPQGIVWDAREFTVGLSSCTTNGDIGRSMLIDMRLATAT